MRKRRLQGRLLDPSVRPTMYEYKPIDAIEKWDCGIVGIDADGNPVYEG